MKTQDDNESRTLRQRAEARHSERASQGAGAPPSSMVDAAVLVHELQVHQIELEIQHEELRRAHAEAETARARFADLYDFAPVGYLTVAEDSSIREANLTSARILGVDRSKLIGLRLGVFFAEVDRPAFNAALSGARETGHPHECGATLATGPEATRPSTYLQMSIAVSPEGELRVAAVDATERRRTEDQVRTSQKLEAIGQLAGGVAHDFNNLLTVIVSNCALALDAVDNGTPLREPLAEVKGAADRAAALTSQLLAFNHKQVVRPRVVNLNALVRDIATLLRRLIGEDIELVLSLDDDLEPIEIDPAQLDQVIMNLAVNARDAMPGGGTLTVSTANVDADQRRSPPGSHQRSGACVRLSVRDTGTGMDAQTMQRIFEPFFTTKEVGRGTGLGLATVLGIVKSSGGDVSVRSEPGAGTTFQIDFPRSSELAGPPASQRGDMPAPKGTETILVVEDEPSLLRVALRILSSAGYTVLGAASGDEALALCEQHGRTIHLVVSDVVMPGMSGVMLGERLRSLREDIKILYMSGYTADVIRRGRGDQAMELLHKPFTPSQLKRKVREVLDS